MDRKAKDQTIDDFYGSKRWKTKRAHILRRDGWLDQVAIRDGVHIEADTVHHILPREEWPQYEWCDWNLISVNNNLTHKGRLHQKFTGKLTKFGKMLMNETALKQGINLKMVTLVIGKPGTGKSAWAKRNLQGGLAYDMDSIASAFRLTAPHKEPSHAGARRMAAALRSGWLAAAHDFTNNVFVIRTAPDVEELEETRPDRLVVCTKLRVQRPYKIDEADYDLQIHRAIEWAEANEIQVEYDPPRGQNVKKV